MNYKCMVYWLNILVISLGLVLAQTPYATLSAKTKKRQVKTAKVVLPKKKNHKYSYVLPGVKKKSEIVLNHLNNLYSSNSNNRGASFYKNDSIYSHSADYKSADYKSADYRKSAPSFIPRYTLASTSIYGRVLTKSFKLTNEGVKVSCLKPQLLALIKKIEQKFKRPIIISSGYRSPSYNRKVHGAKHSQHIYCAAVDLEVLGVNKWVVADYVRNLPNRGGVGTYCHQFIHVDVGRKRDWNWGCKGKK